MGREFAGEKRPHALVVPFPLQGHINPMMHFAQKLASDGFLVTFVNSEHNHSRIMEAKEKMGSERQADQDNIRMVCISDALPEEVSRSDVRKLLDSLTDTLAPSLQKLIQQINENEPHKITCAVFDHAVYYVRNLIGKHFGIPYALFCTMSVACSAACHLGSTLLSSGIVFPNGTAKVQKMINLLPCMPPLHSTKLGWIFGSEDSIRKHFETALDIEREIQDELVLFNSFYDLEASVIEEYPKKGVKIYKQGRGRCGLRRWSVWIGWTDSHPSPSSTCPLCSLAILNVKQFHELALGLEATTRPFLWVVRSDLLDGTSAEFPPGFVQRVGDRGCIVSWAPQLSVLSHPCIACFISHCGWNSTLESVSLGVPMLCWPYFIDQFLNCSYVVNEWKVGLELIAKRGGLVEKEEIQKAVEKVVGGQEGREMKARAMLLKERARVSMEEKGSSSVNYNLFIETMR
ncbi:hypothetical protein KI387_019778, partial [Taxus chinensis]